MKADASKRELETMDCGLQAKYREGDDHGRGPREQRGPAEIQQGQSGSKHTSKLGREELVPKICLNRFQDRAVAGDAVATEVCKRSVEEKVLGNEDARSWEDALWIRHLPR